MYGQFAYICIKNLWKDVQDTGNTDLAAPGRETGWQVEKSGKESSHCTPFLSCLLISESGECIT